MEQSKREQFTFYRSFFEAIKELPKKEQLPVLTAICEYALNGEEKPLTGAASAVFKLIRPVLDSAAQKAASGKKGGEANDKQTESKPKSKRKQTAREKEVEKEVEKEIEVEIENEVENEIERKDDSQNVPPNPRASDAGDREAVRQEISDDLTAARERWGHWERLPSGSDQNTADRAAEQEAVGELIRAAREKAQERAERYGTTNREEQP